MVQVTLPGHRLYLVTLGQILGSIYFLAPGTRNLRQLLIVISRCIRSFIEKEFNIVIDRLNPNIFIRIIDSARIQDLLAFDPAAKKKLIRTLTALYFHFLFNIFYVPR